MAQPRTAITRLDLSFSYSEFNLRANRSQFIGPKVLPPIGVAKDSGTFLKLDIRSLLAKVEDTKRNPKAGYTRDDFTWTSDSYQTEDHGVEEIIDDRTVKMYGDILDAEFIHAERAINRLLQRYEYDVAAAVFNATTWTDYKTSISVPWTTAKTADPIADIDAASYAVESQCGQKPNTLILTDYALRKMLRTDRIEDLLKYSGVDDPKNVTLSGLAQLLQLDQILVCGGFKNTANPAQTGSLSRVWDTTKAMVCHVHDSQDVEDPRPRIGCTFMWNEENAEIPGSGDSDLSFIVEEYREEGRRGGVLRARNDRQIKILHVQAGHLLTDVTA